MIVCGCLVVGGRACFAAAGYRWPWLAGDLCVVRRVRKEGVNNRVEIARWQLRCGRITCFVESFWAERDALAQTLLRIVLQDPPEVGKRGVDAAIVRAVLFSNGCMPEKRDRMPEKCDRMVAEMHSERKLLAGLPEPRTTARRPRLCRNRSEERMSRYHSVPTQKRLSSVKISQNE